MDEYFTIKLEIFALLVRDCEYSLSFVLVSAVILIWGVSFRRQVFRPEFGWAIRLRLLRLRPILPIRSQTLLPGHFAEVYS